MPYLNCSFSAPTWHLKSMVATMFMPITIVRAIAFLLLEIRNFRFLANASAKLSRQHDQKSH